MPTLTLFGGYGNFALQKGRVPTAKSYLCSCRTFAATDNLSQPNLKEEQDKINPHMAKTR